MRILKTRSNSNSELTLSLPEKFDFHLHGEFKQAYEKAGVKQLILDMNKTKFMDSSALGMLLQLKEYAEQTNSKVSIKNASKNVMQIMEIAHFDKLFKVA
ncbi:MAG: STAS domain-containing protein [Gammaproteobacteria bacterium]|jgi:anti-anti-sigma factor